MTTPPYADEDVQRLVKAARSVQGCLTCQPCTRNLDNALSPFQPDPDAELVKRMEDILNQPLGVSIGARIQALTAAVREHDRRNQ